jgi:hypothetical protein
LSWPTRTATSSAFAQAEVKLRLRFAAPDSGSAAER